MRLAPIQRTWLAGSLVGLAIIGCGPSAPAPETTTPVSETSAAGSTTVEAYFFSDVPSEDGRAGPFLVPVERSAAGGGDPVEHALLALLAGPTNDELAAVPAITSAIPAGSSLLGFEVADGLATIDLSPTFETGGGSFSMRGRLAQLVYTATQFPDVQSVRLKLAGRPVDVFSGEGIVLEHPMTRADFVDMLP